MREEKENEIEIRLSDFATVFKKCWWAMVLAAVVVFVAAYAFTTVTHVDKYTASFSLYILPSSDSSAANNDTAAFSIANALVKDSDSLFLSRDMVLRPALERAGYVDLISVDNFRNCIEVTCNEGSRVAVVTVTTDNSKMSIDLANALEGSLFTYLNVGEDKPFKQYNTVVSHIDSVDENAARKVSNPVSKISLLLFGVLAAVLIYIVAFVVFLMDDRINNEEDLERYLQLNLLGSVPNRRESMRKAGYGYGNAKKN